jgi:hypothetical protein
VREPEEPSKSRQARGRNPSFPHFERRTNGLALALEHRTVFGFAKLTCPTRVVSWSGASCAQASRSYFWKSFLCNTFLENVRLVRKFGGGWKYQNMALHAQSPPNFPPELNKSGAGGLENRRLFTISASFGESCNAQEESSREFTTKRSNTDNAAYVGMIPVSVRY